MGGFTGSYTRDSFYLNVEAKTIEKTPGQVPCDVFPFAVPTLSDVTRQIGFTVDWASFKLLKYENKVWTEVDNLRGGK